MTSRGLVLPLEMLDGASHVPGVSARTIVGRAGTAPLLVGESLGQLAGPACIHAFFVGMEPRREESGERRPGLSPKRGYGPPFADLSSGVRG
jgi:hypothetical protein